MSTEDRAREVAASSCGGDCEMCADYIETGQAILRPASREEYEAAVAERKARS